MKKLKLAKICSCLSIALILLSMLMSVESAGEVHADSYDDDLGCPCYCKITSFKRWPCQFSPNGDGKKDTTTINATFSTSCDWKLHIRPVCPCACDWIREWTGSGKSLSIVWDGKDKAGVVVPDGAYWIELSIQGEWEKHSDRQMRIVVVDTTPPTVTDVTVSPDPFNPLTETTRINYTLSECAWVAIGIFSAKPWTLRRTLIKWEKQCWGFHSIPWDGKDDDGNILPPGTYHVRVYVVDLAINRATIFPAKIKAGIV